MKRLIFLLLLTTSVFLSCEKEENKNDAIPDWLQTKIDEVVFDSSVNVCDICDVTVTEYAGKKYYDFYCGHWSCRYCYFFDQDGHRPQWEQAEWQAYEAGKKQVAVLPACN